MLVGRKSIITGVKSEMDLNVSEKQITLWMEGAIIQNVMPHLTSGEREFLMTGMSLDEQAGIFKDVIYRGDVA